MAKFENQSETFPIEDQLKTLRDSELLDFWEETQHLERFLEEGGNKHQNSHEYERLIIQELQLRSCLRPLKRP